MKKIILMSVGLSALLLSSPVLAKSNHVSLKVNPITGNQTSVNGKTTKLATIKVLHNKALLGKGIASKRGTFKITLKVPIKNGWKYTIQATKRGFAAKKYTVTALYASTKIDQPHYQDEIHDLQNMIVSLQSQLNDLKNKTQQATTTIITEPSNNSNDDSNDDSNSDSNDSNPAPTANQKKIKDLRDQIQAMYKQITTINQNMDQISTSMNKIDPNLNSDIPSSEKLDEYNTDDIDGLNNALSLWNRLATDANKKLNQLSPNDNEYYVVNSKLKRYNGLIKGINEEISHHNSMTKVITDAGGQAGYLEKAKNYSDQYNSLNSQLSDLKKQRNGLKDQINSLSAQIDTLEKQQD